jgi:hypothetical protein
MNTTARYIGISSLVVLVSLSVVVFAADLYHYEVNDKVNTVNGKALIMVLDEIERFDKFSIIRVKFTSGASVPRTMFVVRCYYEMAKLRKADYFIDLKEWTDEKGDQMYKIGFSSAVQN